MDQWTKARLFCPYLQVHQSIWYDKLKRVQQTLRIVHGNFERTCNRLVLIWFHETSTRAKKPRVVQRSFRTFRSYMQKIKVIGNCCYSRFDFTSHNSINWIYLTVRRYVQKFYAKCCPILCAGNWLERLNLSRLDKIFKLFRRNLPNKKSLTLRQFNFYEGLTCVFFKSAIKYKRTTLNQCETRRTTERIPELIHQSMDDCSLSLIWQKIISNVYILYQKIYVTYFQ